MTQKALLQSAGDGTAVPAGYVGEKIDWVSGSFTTLTNNGGYQNVGGASQGITLNRGTYLVTCTGTGQPSTSAMRTQIQIIVSSGSATITNVFGNDDSLLCMDSGGNTMQMNLVSYVVVNQDSTNLKLQANPVSGSISNSRVGKGAAIRIA